MFACELVGGVRTSMWAPTLCELTTLPYKSSTQRITEHCCRLRMPKQPLYARALLQKDGVPIQQLWQQGHTLERSSLCQCFEEATWTLQQCMLLFSRLWIKVHNHTLRNQPYFSRASASRKQCCNYISACKKEQPWVMRTRAIICASDVSSVCQQPRKRLAHCPSPRGIRRILPVFPPDSRGGARQCMKRIKCCSQNDHHRSDSLLRPCVRP